MTFDPSTYVNFVSEMSEAEERLFLRYSSLRNDFDIIIIGSGIGGGVLADDLAEHSGGHKRILVVEAGSFVYPTHAYNFCRFPNFELAKHFACDTFWQNGDSDDENYIGEKPQLNFGGRSIFWSGLIPTIQDWELEFFPPQVRKDLKDRWLQEAGTVMNESRSMGTTAQAIVARLQQSALSGDFVIEETPRALHQPYLKPDGTPMDQFFTEPTGVFNTAELLINQVGLTPGLKPGDGPGLHLLLNHYVEDIQNHGNFFQLITRDTLNGQIRTLTAGTVVLAAGSIESPKLLRRSSMYPSFSNQLKPLVGRGLTDHPTSNELVTCVTNIGDVQITKRAHAKIIFYSKGHRDANNQIRYPFNVEMNINHEYWHLRNNDPSLNDPGAFSTNDPAGPSRVDIKFSFGNCLDENNEIKAAPPFGYVPEIVFRNQSWMSHLAGSRFPAFAGWQKSFSEVFDVMNTVADQIFSQFQINGQPASSENNSRFGNGGNGFGWGTVHHAAGSLRMPFKSRYTDPFNYQCIVDENLEVAGIPNLYICDMSVMPLSSTANPVRTLVALALRLSQHLA